jgi:sugar O-acyltransferase (sialic acid O-acetyltransferase NeuD family)
MSNNNNIAIIGYSGHAYVCLEIADLMNLVVTGYFDVEEKSFNPYNLTFLGSEEIIKEKKLVFIGIGDNKLRSKIYNSSIIRGLNLSTNLIHPNSIISQKVEIGMNNLIGPGVIINPLAKIGNACILNSGSIIEHECAIGDFVHIAPGAVLAGNVQIGERSFIGANSVIKQGVIIGKDVIVGAGSVILNDIQDNQIVVGNPAKPLIKNK